jgi:hypothetical protein
MDNFIHQRRIVWATEQAKPLLENCRVRFRCILRTVLVKPRIQLSQFVRGERIDGAFDVLDGFQFHWSGAPFKFLQRRIAAVRAYVT